MKKAQTRKGRKQRASDIPLKSTREIARLCAELTRANDELKRQIKERQRAETELREKEVSFREAEIALAHFNRITTMGELAASVAHEVNQPLGCMVNSANAGLRWLAKDPPDLTAARRSLQSIIIAGHRAGGIVAGIRALAKKTPPQKDRLNLSEMIAEVIAMLRTEILANRVLLQTKLAPDLPLVTGDKIQLQQVVLNLLVNAIEAMSELEAERRELIVGSERISNSETELSEDGFESQTRTGTEPSYVLFSVRDSGSGLDPEHLDHVFKAFYTTKSQGLGMGLAISHSIIQAHGGRLWAKPNSPRGAVFQFTLPTGAP